MEKLAPALLAGVPSIVKPASATAYVAERALRRVIDSGVLPEGALQLVCGSARDLLDPLGGQDLLAFTGSADTAARLRAHPAVTGRSLRVNVEADSLNACVLGPDGQPGTAVFDLFVDTLATEMTTKSGQRCTAVRRALVPRDLLDAVGEAVAARLAQVVVGTPLDPATRMGPLVDLEQREAVREAVARLLVDAVLVHGKPDDVAVQGGDPVLGAFLSPLLLRADDGAAAAPHDVEAFGPVSTLIPYDRPDQVAELLARGKGSLVASVVSADGAFVDDVVLEAAAHHGRLLVLDPDCAADSTGHGTPLPQLVHGGPGRAGGGEEEGGLRAVKHHMQRTALQGSPAVLERLVAL